MGILWTVWPLDEVMKNYLDDEGVDYPSQPSRFPTGIEIKNSLQCMHGYRIQYYDNGIGSSWQASIESTSNPEESSTSLIITEYSGDNEQQYLWFEKGDENLIKQVLKELVKMCGPLTLIADCGGLPQVIKT